MPSPTKRDDLIAQFGEFLNPRPQQTQSVFPAPQRMFDPASPAYKPMTAQFGQTPGGRYLGMGPGGPQDITGARPAAATVSTPATGKASFQVSPQQVEQTGTPGKGKVKTNLFKRRAGWQWVGEPPAVGLRHPRGCKASGMMDTIIKEGQNGRLVANGDAKLLAKAIDNQ